MSWKIMTKAAEQRKLYRRLEAAGCRLDFDNLPPPPSPLRVSSAPWQWPTHVFPMGPATAVVVPIRIAALQACSIRDASYQRNWFPEDRGEFLGACPETQRGACFQDDDGTHYHLDVDWVLRLKGSVFKRGDCREGYYVFLYRRPLPFRTRTNLEFLLNVTDGFGDEYPFDLCITCDPAAAAAASAALVSTYRRREKKAAILVAETNPQISPFMRTINSLVENNCNG